MAALPTCKASLLAAAHLLFFQSAGAEDGLVFPVLCNLGQDCMIQQYVDRDPGPGAVDYACGPLSYNGHRGTDIRLRNDQSVENDIAVVAAAAGRVVALRDGLPDHRQGTPEAPNVDGKECGNGVLIEAPDGWRFQYCHLKKGSIAVRKGQSIGSGAPIGAVGLSGKTQFAHLHLTIRDASGDVVDPFDGLPQSAGCALAPNLDKALWRHPDAVTYRAGGAIGAGFSDHVPNYEDIKSGLIANSEPLRSSDAFVFWAEFFGLRPDDTIRMFVEGPDNYRLQKDFKLERQRTVAFRALGRRNKHSLTSGVYRGRAELIRDSVVIDSILRKIEVN